MESGRKAGGYLNHEWTRIFLGLEFDWLSVLVLGFFEGLVVWGFEPRMDTNEHEFLGLEFDSFSVLSRHRTAQSYGLGPQPLPC